MITFAVFSFVLSMVGEVKTPRMLEDEARREKLASDPGPYSLSEIHVRMPTEGIERINAYIRLFQTEGRRRLRDGLDRGGRYLERYRRIFRKKGLPEELVYLPLIESGYVLTAVSPAQAAGIWQFIEETGRRYNLKRSAWFDRRFDPFKSAEAAASLLQNLYRTFNSWELALAAYNAGPGTIRWAIRKNRKAGKPVNFWALELPEETRNYVPNFIAAVLIIKTPEAYGFKKFEFQPQLVYEYLKVSPGTDLDMLASEIGISTRTLKNLNPELIQGVVPPGEEPYSLRVPQGLPRIVMTRLAGRRAKYRDWLVHPVAFHDTVEELASRFRANPSMILKTNGLETAEELFMRNLVIIPL
ncbi:MAG: lytic transglycosylase domain-containing protein [SAR324 cluster bacterium]|nr:lytic transglycosylase domain-containing protein [SAR324 cluster bacterium]